MISKAQRQAVAAHAYGLATQTARLNELLKLAEEELITLNLGVTAWVQTREQPLYFCKWDGAWGLHVHTDGGMVPLLKASRANRTAAADVLSTLVEMLLKTVEYEAQRVREATAKVNEVLDAFTESRIK